MRKFSQNIHLKRRVFKIMQLRASFQVYNFSKTADVDWFVVHKSAFDLQFFFFVKHSQVGQTKTKNSLHILV